MTPEILGYVAIAISLIAMSCKEMKWLRIAHGLSALIYIGYGFWIEAYPILIGGVIFSLIHSYHLYKLLIQKST